MGWLNNLSNVVNTNSSNQSLWGYTTTGTSTTFNDFSNVIYGLGKQIQLQSAFLPSSIEQKPVKKEADEIIWLKQRVKEIMWRA